MVLRWWVSQAQKLIWLSDDGDMLVLQDAQISRTNGRVHHEQDHVVKLLRQFNVSKWLLREVLAGLQRQGLVKAVPGRGGQ